MGETRMKKILLAFLAIVIISTPLLSGQKGAILFYNNKTAFVDGQRVYLPTPATIIDGQTMVPLDFIASLTGSKVNYDNGFIQIDHIERNKPEVYFDSNAKEPLLKLINDSKKSIDIQMFSFTNTDIINALNSIVKIDGINIRLLLRDTIENQGSAEKLIDELGGGSLAIKFTKRYLHRKIAVFDNQHVWLGSTNWSGKGFSSNVEVDVSIEDKDLAQDVTEQFDKDWNDQNKNKEESNVESEVEQYYIGNSKPESMLFHRPNCSHAKNINKENVIIFDTTQDAIKANYKPCKVCKP